MRTFSREQRKIIFCFAAVSFFVKFAEIIVPGEGGAVCACNDAIYGGGAVLRKRTGICRSSGRGGISLSICPQHGRSAAQSGFINFGKNVFDIIGESAGNGECIPFGQAAVQIEVGKRRGTVWCCGYFLHGVSGLSDYFRKLFGD